MSFFAIVLTILWVPDGYVCTYKSDDGTMWEFTNKEDHWITLIMLPDSAGIDLDTENASIVEHCVLVIVRDYTLNARMTIH